MVAQSQEYYNNYADPLRDSLCQQCDRELPRLNVNGWRGKPWRDGDLGGCKCGSKCGFTNYNFSTSWPSPFSVLLDFGSCGDQRRSTVDTRNGRLRDKLDLLAGIRLVGPIRSDNGYCGPGCDPYGYLGKSQRGLEAPVIRHAAEGVPEIAPTGPLTMISDSPMRPSNSPALGKLTDFKRFASEATMSQLDQQTRPSVIEGVPTVLTGNGTPHSVARKETGVVWESVTDDANSRETMRR